MTTPVEPRLAASLILMRDTAAGPEVLMIRRHEALRFAPGATVFPGGRLDPEDYGEGGEAGGDHAHRNAAIREAFEEAGILLPRPAALATLVPFARWLTPESVWRRFDTTFFLAEAPPDQEPRVDGGEAVAALWGRPAELLAAADAGALSLVFATRMTLLRLAPCRTVAEAVAEARRVQPLLPILPSPAEGADGPVMRIPDGHGFPVRELPLERVRLG